MISTDLFFCSTLYYTFFLKCSSISSISIIQDYFYFLLNLVTTVPSLQCQPAVFSTQPSQSHLELSHIVRKTCVPSTANHWQWWAFISLSVLSSNTRLNNWSPKLIISALRELEANIWNLFVRNKMNDIFSGVLACTCTYKSPWGPLINKFNQEQKAESSGFEPFGWVPVKGPRKKAGTRMPWRQNLMSSPLPLQDKE